MKKFFENLPWQVVFIAFLGIFFFRNLLMPNVADDYSYMYIWDGAGRGNLLDSIDPNRLQRVESVADIFISQWQHYFTWGGRTISHIFVQFFLLFDKIFFDVTNVLVFAALVLLLFKIGTGLNLREMNKSYLLLILAGIYFCAPSLLITTIWLTGTCNYLWMSTLEILFLLPFVMSYRRKKIVLDSRLLVPAMALLGLLAGWASEPGGAATLFLTALLIINLRRKKNLQLWEKVGFIFLAIGFAILILSPGNLHRAALIKGLEPESVSLMDSYSLNMFKENFLQGFLPIFLREIILFVPIAIYFVNGRTSPEVTRHILLFAMAAILVLVVMIFSPIFPERAGFSSTIFLLVASLAALKEILPDVENFCRRRIKAVTFIATGLMVCWSLSLLGCLYVEYKFNRQVAERYQIAIAHKNDDVVVVPPIKLPSWSEKFLGSRTWDNFALMVGGDLNHSDINNRNITFCHRHGLKKIITAE